MKKIFVIGALACAALLAACGGGSTGGITPPTTGPTQSPTAYTVSLKFIGQLAGRQVQSALRQTATAQSSPIPVMIVSPSQEDCVLNMNCVPDAAMSLGGQVEAQVSPMPSSVPAVHFSQNATHVLISPTPTPSGTPQPLPTGVIGVANVMGDGTTQVQSSGTATASIGTPMNVISTIQEYQYYRVDITDGISPSPGQYQGWAFDGTKWVGDNDPTTADIYVTCSSCRGAFQVANDSSTLHFDGGGTFISNGNVYAWVSAGQWANTYTSLPINTIGQFNPDGSTNSLLIAKTRGLFSPSVPPTVFKVFPLSTETTCNGDCGMYGAIETSGASVDGF